MGSIAPWWGSSVIALGGAAFTAALGAVFTILSRRTETRRLSREDRLSAYRRLAKAARTLAKTVVWPTDPEAMAAERNDVLEIAEEVAFLGSARVNAAVETLVIATEAHCTLIAEIREDSDPAHRGGIDRRFQAKYSTSVTELRGAIDDFTRAGRAELEIRGAYRPIESAGDQTADGTP
ncbi:hypothetical protein [Nocardia callitridis]|uniref:DUF4760 domain-containing protein n=1 Tax=Nocardia callitridis TaxID=648753 RepID=A0ABP9KDY2_9NOCA